MIKAEVRIIDTERPNEYNEIHLIEPTEIEETGIETIHRFNFCYCVLDKEYFDAMR